MRRDRARPAAGGIGAVWRAADGEGIETVMLAPRRARLALPLIAAPRRGFLYSVGLLGVTGERQSLAASATALAARLKASPTCGALVSECPTRPSREAVSGRRGVVQGAASSSG